MTHPEINQEKVDDFRQCVLETHQQLKEDFPEALEDLTRRSLFNSLLSVTSKEALKDWINAFYKTDIPQEGALHTRKGLYENLLVETGRKAVLLSEGELELAAKDIATLAKNDFKIDIGKVFTQIDAKRKEMPVDANGSVVLYKSGKEYFAFGQDAITISVDEGWQMAECADSRHAEKAWGSENTTQKFCCMLINEEGLKVLNKRLPPPVVVEASELMRDLKHLEINGQERSFAQQTLDYFRGLRGSEIVSWHPGNLHYSTIHNNLYQVVHTVESVVFDKNNINVVEENGRVLPLMAQGEWNVNANTEPALLAVWRKLQYASPLERYFQNYEEYRASEISNNEHACERYFNEKEKQMDGLLVMRINDKYYALGNDAVAVAKSLKSTLWQMETSNHQQILVAAFSVNDCYMDVLELDGQEVRMLKGGFPFNGHPITLELSPLNEGLKSTLNIENVTIFKRRDGKFAVRAMIDDTEMESMEVPAQSALNYYSLPSGLEKDTTLKTMAVNAYKNVLAHEWQNIMKTFLKY